MAKQILRTEVQNMEKKKLLSDVEIGETVGVRRGEDDIEKLNEESDEVHGDLEVSIEQEENRVDVAEKNVCQEKNVLMFVGKEKNLAIER